MRILAAILFVHSAACLAETDLHPVGKEMRLHISGKEYVIETGVEKELIIDGKKLPVKLSYGDYMTFSNYGLSFKLPAETSGYLDEQGDGFDIWNFDYGSAVMLLFAINGGGEVSNDLLWNQLTKLSSNISMELGEPTYLMKKSFEDIRGVNAPGKIGIQGFLVEMYGFSSPKKLFLVFMYSPIESNEEKSASKVSYKAFTETFFSSLKM